MLLVADILTSSWYQFYISLFSKTHNIISQCGKTSNNKTHSDKTGKKNKMQKQSFIKGTSSANDPELIQIKGLKRPKVVAVFGFIPLQEIRENSIIPTANFNHPFELQKERKIFFGKTNIVKIQF